ncbi:UDP-glucose 4-epimerase [Nakamurella panacisegetis]|uniref:UDP-glucose 4-epimerase n=1 Tax=Nakamurella panacisegetis TaxID=1090615 RepID=A0A1H0PII0_9ACTN|nr:NAD-dependent epimerase/dehydratase family protein [Nakamurella panacisegetis]SDP04857.1 UDP-glucose 4-epimerase [Nakamurella panacisegetis]
MTLAVVPTSSPVTWVVGAGGLLGSALCARLRSDGGTVLRQRVGWSGERAGADLLAGLAQLSAHLERAGGPWRVVWCAGAGVTGSSAQALQQEIRTLTSFLDRMTERAADLGPGTFFLASSAGGLYAGTPSDGHAFSELDPVNPISPYGEAKLAAELAVTRYAEATGNQVQIGRIANLYGPGQNLSKGQGLISALCRSHLTRRPISVYVSLDTIRDYLFVDDCADMIADMLDVTTPGRQAGEVVLKILASQHGTTIATLVAACRQVFKRPPLLILGTSAQARFQVLDLRLRSFVWPEIDHRTLMPLPAGIAATTAAIQRSIQRPHRDPSPDRPRPIA